MWRAGPAGQNRFGQGHKPRHATTYRTDVDSAAYPEARHNIPMNPAEFAAFKAGIGG